MADKTFPADFKITVPQKRTHASIEAIEAELAAAKSRIGDLEQERDGAHLYQHLLRNRAEVAEAQLQAVTQDNAALRSEEGRVRLNTELLQLQARNRELAEVLKRASGMLHDKQFQRWKPWADLCRAMDAALAASPEAPKI